MRWLARDTWFGMCSGEDSLTCREQKMYLSLRHLALYVEGGIGLRGVSSHRKESL